MQTRKGDRGNKNTNLGLKIGSDNYSGMTAEASRKRYTERRVRKHRKSACKRGKKK